MNSIFNFSTKTQNLGDCLEEVFERLPQLSQHQSRKPYSHQTLTTPKLKTNPQKI